MISDFLVAHPDNPFFQLTQNEWKTALSKHPELSEADSINYVERSASASIQVGYQGYFDNNAIIRQFTRLFKMLPFKKEYAGHSITVVVDNARTHNAKEFSLDDFGMKIGTRCPVAQIHYVDENGHQQIVNCFFEGGAHKGKSKGLMVLAKELGVKVPNNVKLAELKRLLSSHDAFQQVGVVSLSLFIPIPLCFFHRIIFRYQSWRNWHKNLVLILYSHRNSTVSSTV